MIEVALGAERTGADADGSIGKGAQGAVDIWGAVQTGTDRDIEGLVEDATDLGCGQRLAAETQRADTPRRVTMPEHLESSQFFQLPPKSLGKLHFMAPDAIEALL